MKRRRSWITIQAGASCHDCEWEAQFDDAVDPAGHATQAARRHHEKTGHEVQVAKGSVLMFNRAGVSQDGARG